jgi:hypothetical protein
MGKVFVSYSHQDEQWKERVVKHLKVLAADGLEVWDDRRIGAGADWEGEIAKAIAGCDLALLLVSVDFLNSRFIRGREVPPLLERRQGEGVRVVPVILSPCAWSRVPWLSAIQARPRDGKPLSGMSRHAAEVALADLAGEIADLLLKPAEVSSIVVSPSGSADSVQPVEPQRQPANLPQSAMEEIDKSLGFSPALCSALARELGGDKDSTPATIARRLCSPTADFLTVLDALDKGLRALARPPKPAPHEIEQIQKNALTVLGWVSVATVADGYEQEDAQLAKRWREGAAFRVPLGRGPCVEVITARWRDGKAEFGIDPGNTDHGHDDLVPAVIQEIGFDAPEHLTPHRAVDAVWGRVHQEMLRRQANEPVRGARRQDAARWLAGQVRKYKRRLRLVLDVHHPLASPEVLREIHEQLPDLLLILVDDEADEDPHVFILHPAELSAAIYDCLDAIRSLP